MKPTDPPPVRPHLCDKVHEALVRAGRPVTRSELIQWFLPGTSKAADVKAALDALAADGLAVRGEEPGHRPWQRFEVWRAVCEGEGAR